MATKTKSEPITADWIRSLVGLEHCFKDGMSRYPDDEATFFAKRKDKFDDRWWLLSFKKASKGNGWSPILNAHECNRFLSMYWMPPVTTRQQVLNVMAVLGIEMTS